MGELTGSGQTYTVGKYTVFNNDWDVGSLIIGQDFTETISYNDNGLQSGVVMSWSYPDTSPASGDGVYAYPELVWGAQYGGLGGVGSNAYTAQISSIKSLLVNYSVALSGDTNEFDVGIEIWTTTEPPDQSGSDISSEIMVKVHGWSADGLSDGPGLAYSDPYIEAVENINYEAGGAPKHTFVTIDTTADVLTGQLDFATILDRLVAEGVISGNDYVSGVELGFEMQGGAGSATINNFSVAETLGPANSINLTSDDFNADGVSDLLIQNTTGAVVAGEVVNGQTAYTQVAALGPEWSFEGTGDFLGDGQSDFLIESTSGLVVVGQVVNGQTTYTQVAALGPEWSFRGTGDFLGDGQSDFLMENTSGAVVVGEVVNGHAQYSAIGGLGPEWSFVGSGDFLGDGKDQFLIENTSGAVVVGEVTDGQTTYTQVAALGPEWKFEESGNFLGNGLSGFLIENTAGAVAVGEVVNGQAQYTSIGGLGPEWNFVGAGDYGGTGTDSFVIENTSGAVSIGTVAGGQAQYAQVAALGPEWRFHG